MLHGPTRGSLLLGGSAFLVSHCGADLLADITGTNAGETLSGTTDADRINGRKGDDILRGLAGDDTYVWAPGDGNDFIYETQTASFDILELGAGVLPEGVMLSRPSNASTGALILTIAATGETITLANQFNYISTTGSVTPIPSIDEIRFANGTVWTARDLENHFLRSTDGDDFIQGFTRRMDRLDGGAGNDLLRGLSHFDTYVFGRGYGIDTIDDSTDFTEPFPGDIIEFKADIAPTDLIFERQENETRVSNGVDVILQVAGTDDRLIVQNRAESFEVINFAGSHVYWTMAYVHSRYEQAHSTSGDDNFIRLDEKLVETGAGDDRIVGPIRGAELHGGGGSDTYVFKAGGYNRDVIFESGSLADLDIIEFAEAFEPEWLEVFTAANGRDLILAPPGGARIIVKDALVAANFGIDGITFKDGTMWDRATLVSKAVPLMSAATFVTGGAADETLTGTGTFDGGAGADILQGAGDEDTYLYRVGSGDDQIIEGYGQGSDTLRLQGLNRADVAISRSGSDMKVTILSTGEVLTVQNQFSTSYAFYGVEEIIFADGTVLDRAAFLLPPGQGGTSGHDVLTGTSGADVLRGLSGDDTLEGLAGADTLDGGSGNDTLVGGTGDDILKGGSGNDVVHLQGVLSDYRLARNADGSVSVTALAGAEGTDTLFDIEHLHLLGDGSTYILANLVADYGTSGDDGWIEGTSGADSLYGLAGDDTLAGRGGDDVYDGGAGEDTISLLGSLSDYTLVRRADGTIAVTTVSGIDGNDLLRNIEGVFFEGDQLFRSVESLVGQYGTSGDDSWIEGSTSGDRLYGLAGDDTLIGRGGDDRLDGGAGYDQANYVGRFADFVFTRQADGSITATDTTGTEGVDTLVDIEAVYFAGDQTWAGLANVVANYGTPGDDAWVEGTTADDHLYGLAGDDTLVGRAGDDFLYGGDGYDQANYFGSSTDFSFVLNANGTVTVTDLTGGEGADVLSGVEAIYFAGNQVWSTLDALLSPGSASNAPTGATSPFPASAAPFDIEEGMVSATPTGAQFHQEYMFA